MVVAFDAARNWDGLPETFKRVGVSFAAYIHESQTSLP